jgi:hypothetical protein
MEELFQHVQAFDANRDGFIDGAEMKLYLVAVDAWDSEAVYTDANWPKAWPAICKMMQADSTKGLPLQIFKMYHEKYRRGKLAHDLRQLEKHQSWVKLFDHVLAFDDNADGFIDAAEMKAYLTAVGAWGSETVYTDANWPRAWPAIVKMLGGGGDWGLAIGHFKAYHEKYRPGKLESDLEQLETAGAAFSQEGQALAAGQGGAPAGQEVVDVLADAGLTAEGATAAAAKIQDSQGAQVASPNDESVIDVLADMGLSEEEATAAAAKLQAMQRGKLARRELSAAQAASPAPAPKPSPELDQPKAKPVDADRSGLISPPMSLPATPSPDAKRAAMPNR